MLSDEWLPRYRLLENFTAKWNGNGNGNGNAYDRGDYNSSFALRAVELKKVFLQQGSNYLYPASMFISDDFPAPEGPITAVNSPELNFPEIPLRMSLRPANINNGMDENLYVPFTNYLKK